jgi:hypothetical protein
MFSQSRECRRRTIGGSRDDHRDFLVELDRAFEHELIAELELQISSKSSRELIVCCPLPS